MLKIAICGISGKMGIEIEEHLNYYEYFCKKEGITPEIALILGIDSPQKISENDSTIPIRSIESLTDNDVKDLDGIIDFSHKNVTINLLKKLQTLPLKSSFSLVIGTTGFTKSEEERIEEFSKKYPVLKSSNMSIGVNALLVAMEQITKILDPFDFDKEIIEIHHKEKRDAPSGTSVSLQEAIQKGSSSNINFLYGREGMLGKRTDNESGSFSVRGGDVVGDHTVYFLGDGERIELKHQAHSRKIFSQGAIHALRYLHDKDKSGNNKKPAMYSMQDVLGFTAE